VAAARVEVGGVAVTCAEALRACEVLRASGGTAIQSVLAAAGSPLASCDYHAVYRPGLAAARRALEATGRPGGAGRRLARYAFERAVRQQVASMACRALRGALAAFSSDERYAVAVAGDAVALGARSGRPRGAAVIADADACRSADSAAA
jgi:hypothetical protein